jgi:hypothetical protein
MSEAQKGPLTWENVPKVGLDLHSSPCKHWAPAETYGIRPSPPPPVRPHPKPRMWTVSTPPFLTDFNNFEQCRTPLLRGAEVLCRCRTLFRSGLPARAYWTGTQRRTAATEGYLIGRCTSVDSPPGFAGRDLIPEKHPVHQGRLTPTMPRARTNCCHCDHLHLLGVNRQCVDSSSLQSSHGGNARTNPANKEIGLRSQHDPFMIGRARSQ